MLLRDHSSCLIVSCLLVFVLASNPASLAAEEEAHEKQS